MDKTDKIITFDIETDFQWAPYAILRTVGYQIGLDGEPQILDLNDPFECDHFRYMLANPDWTKIHFNGINFDEIVLRRYGFPTNPQNRHDVYLMAKTCHASLPAYGLKFLNCYFFSDWHEPERELRAWCTANNQPPTEAPSELVNNYCMYDVVQTVRLFKMYWPIVRRNTHWRAYNQLELPFGEVLHEIMLDGGEWVNVGQIDEKIQELTHVNDQLELEAIEYSHGEITNLNSTKQVARYLKEFEQRELEISDKGNLVCRKEDLLTLLDLDNPENDTSRIARLCFEIRSNTKQLGYLRAFRDAAEYELGNPINRQFYNQWKCVKIPKSYSLSTARTRRFTSSSKYGINFQNQDKHSKQIALCPPGWITFSIDLTQIENVVHIYESRDGVRRLAYEADPDWNEYVWLGNMVMGTNMTKDEMDSIPSHVNNKWTIYKQFKTIKLAMNFGLGVASFAEKNGLEQQVARRLYETVHKACPAIRNLQTRVKFDLQHPGYVADPFGHIYNGKEPYKVVAYLIQGCGTGSIPKAIARGIYDILHREFPPGAAYLTSLIHDEVGFRIRMDQGNDKISNAVSDCLRFCSQGISRLFDDIPIRSKLYLTRTNLAELKEVKLEHLRKTLDELTHVKTFGPPPRSGGLTP